MSYISGSWSPMQDGAATYTISNTRNIFGTIHELHGMYRMEVHYGSSVMLLGVRETLHEAQSYIEYEVAKQVDYV